MSSFHSQSVDPPDKSVIRFLIVSVEWTMLNCAEATSRICEQLGLSGWCTFLSREIKQLPLIRLYGLTPGGQKTLLNIHGALPYFFVHVPAHLTQPFRKRTEKKTAPKPRRKHCQRGDKRKDNQNSEREDSAQEDSDQDEHTEAVYAPTLADLRDFATELARALESQWHASTAQPGGLYAAGNELGDAMARPGARKQGETRARAQFGREQVIHAIDIVRGVQFYGYHQSDDLFFKISLYNPDHQLRCAAFLRQGIVVSGPKRLPFYGVRLQFQPFESHIPFLLQFFCDYNLYGMNYLLFHLQDGRFRLPLPPVLDLIFWSAPPPSSSTGTTTASSSSSSSPPASNPSHSSQKPKSSTLSSSSSSTHNSQQPLISTPPPHPISTPETPNLKRIRSRLHLPKIQTAPHPAPPPTPLTSGPTIPNISPPNAANPIANQSLEQGKAINVTSPAEAALPSPGSSLNHIDQLLDLTTSLSQYAQRWTEQSISADLCSTVPKTSSCELEVDILTAHIQNPHHLSYQSASNLNEWFSVNQRLVPSVRQIWKDQQHFAQVHNYTWCKHLSILEDNIPRNPSPHLGPENPSDDATTHSHRVHQMLASVFDLATEIKAQQCASPLAHDATDSSGAREENPPSPSPSRRPRPKSVPSDLFSQASDFETLEMLAWLHGRGDSSSSSAEDDASSDDTDFNLDILSSSQHLCELREKISIGSPLGGFDQPKMADLRSESDDDPSFSSSRLEYFDHDHDDHDDDVDNNNDDENDDDDDDLHADDFPSSSIHETIGDLEEMPLFAREIPLPDPPGPNHKGSKVQRFLPIPQLDGHHDRGTDEIEDQTPLPRRALSRAHRRQQDRFREHSPSLDPIRSFPSRKPPQPRYQPLLANHPQLNVRRQIFVPPKPPIRVKLEPTLSEKIPTIVHITQTSDPIKPRLIFSPSPKKKPISSPLSIQSSPSAHFLHSRMKDPSRFFSSSLCPSSLFPPIGSQPSSPPHQDYSFEPISPTDHSPANPCEPISNPAQARVLEIVRACQDPSILAEHFASIMPPNKASHAQWISPKINPPIILPGPAAAEPTTTPSTPLPAMANPPLAADLVNRSVNRELISLLSLEVHVNCRRNFRPDPAHDPIAAIGYAVRDYRVAQHLKEGYRDVVGFLIVGENLPAYAFLSEEVGVDCFESEAELFTGLYQLIRRFNPDILLGYEVELGSLGYLIDRGACPTQLSRLLNPSNVHTPVASDAHGMGKTVNIPGRILMNVWRVMRSEKALRSYSIYNVAAVVLGERLPEYSYQYLTTMYQSSSYHDHLVALTHLLARAKLNLALLDKLEVISRTSEQARVFGIDFFSVLARGSQYRVESLMLRMTRASNFMLASPGRDEVSAQRPPQCIPLVMEPFSAFYHDPVVVLDFQSLYPSIMIAYNYCYSTCLGSLEQYSLPHPKLGTQPYELPLSLFEQLIASDAIHISPNNVMFLKAPPLPASSVPDNTHPLRSRGILPRLLQELLETRVMIKNQMKVAPVEALKRQMDACQQALKMILNVTYGYTSASFSGRMPCVDLADAIVQTARETLESAIRFIEAKWPNTKVVYGDTDSVFVYLPGRSRAQAFQLGRKMAEAVTRQHPAPIKLQFEKVFQPCALVNKKRYVGYAFTDAAQTEPVFDAKGIETVRRDNCPLVAEMLEGALHRYFKSSDILRVKLFVQSQLTKLLTGKVSLDKLTFAKEVRLGTYAEGRSWPAHVQLTIRLRQQDPRFEPRYGERIPYVIVCGSSVRDPLSTLVRTPFELLLHSDLRLNVAYYIEKQILPPLHRIFGLLLEGVDVFSWYRALPRYVRFSWFTTGGGMTTGQISSYFIPLTCALCKCQIVRDAQINRLLQRLSVDAHTLFCITCLANSQESYFQLSTKLSSLEKKLSIVRHTCLGCIRYHRDIDACISLDCPKFFLRNTLTNKLRHTQSILDSYVNQNAFM